MFSREEIDLDLLLLLTIVVCHGRRKLAVYSLEYRVREMCLS
jgi:hypothetical protein